MLGLTEPHAYEYLATDDSDEYMEDVATQQSNFQDVVTAFHVCGFLKEEVDDIFKLLAAVLHISNITFRSQDMDEVQVKNRLSAGYLEPSCIETVSRLAGLLKVFTPGYEGLLKVCTPGYEGILKVCTPGYEGISIC